MSITTLDFPNRTQLEQGLNVCFKVYIPSTRDKSIKIHVKTFNARIKEVGHWLTQKFAGATIDYVYGEYKYKEKIIGEDVAIISVFTTSELYNKQDLELKKYLREKKYAWGQDSIGFEYQDKMVFI